MKKSCLSIFFTFCSLLVFSQDNICESSYMPFKQGTVLEYTNYDRKGKTTGSQRQSVSNLNKSDGLLQVTLDFTTLDKKGKKLSDGSFDLECDGSTVRMDMSNMMPAEMMENYQDLEAEITGEDIQFPNDPKAGQELPDGEMTVEASMGGFGSMKTTIKMVNRKVETFEEVTTSAGVFACVKISQETIAEVMGIKNTSKSITWLAKGIGTVKTENYSNHDKLQSSMVLTALEK